MKNSEKSAQKLPIDRDASLTESKLLGKYEKYRVNPKLVQNTNTASVAGDASLKINVYKGKTVHLTSVHLSSNVESFPNLFAFKVVTSSHSSLAF